MSYAELHCLSNFSFLRGASHPEELVRRAAELGYRALALTDECSVAGVVRAYEAARELPLQLIVGSEFRLTDSAAPAQPGRSAVPPDNGERVVLLAPDRQAYAQLCRLITLARRRADKGAYRLGWEDLAADSATHPGRCLLLYRAPASWKAPLDTSVLSTRLTWLSEQFSGRAWLLLERLLAAGDEVRYRLLLGLADQSGVPAVCGNAVLMHHPARQPLLDVLTAIRHRTTVQQAGFHLAANAERHLRSLKKLRHLYGATLMAETLKIAERCAFCLSELRYEYPAELVPEGVSASAHLRRLVEDGARKRFPDGPSERLRQQIEHELALIQELRYEPYFLTIEDIVRFARSRDILCQGRGSAANSIVCYCLHITEVDPREVSLLVERFISRERREPPDIDVDFEHERREEVIQYIYQRYGRERAGLAATVISYRARSAIRDVGKALGMEESHLAWLISQLDRRDGERHWLEQLRDLGGGTPDWHHRLLVERVEEILDFPRHLSQHVGGFVITAGPLHELVPVENAAMRGRTVIQWNKDDLETLGLLKVDILALGMLSAIRKTLALLSAHRQQPLRLQDIPREDPATYEMLCQADSMGVFQVESRAQMSMLPRLKPRNYYDLVVEVAIVRPGPIQGDMVHPYLKRREGLETVEYPSPEVRAVLERTLGVPIFQEQVIRLAMVAAGFSGGEADQLRRAMAAWRRSGTIRRYQLKLVEGMLARGYPRDFAERICRQIEGFGEYGFPESHAASFALLVYLSAWLKRHEPAAFCCGLLNSQPMGFYSPAQLVQDARRHSVEVRPVTLNASDWDATLEWQTPPPERSANTAPSPPPAPPGLLARRTYTATGYPQPALRLGLRLVKGLSREGARQLVACRPAAGYVSIADARQRCRLTRHDWEALAASGALNHLARHRYQARWELLAQSQRLELSEENDLQIRDAAPLALPAPSEQADLEEDFRHLGLSLGRHPLALLREAGLLTGCLQATELPQARPGQLVQVAGLVTNRQRPGTAAGVTFVTLEDETGQVNLVVWQATARAQRQALLRAHILQVAGVLERESGVTHVVAGRLRDISAYWNALRVKSRDFR